MCTPAEAEMSVTGPDLPSADLIDPRRYSSELRNDKNG